MDSPKKSNLTIVFPTAEVIIPGRGSVQKFLREADPSNPLERSCVSGKRDCVATHMTHPCTGNSEGLWLREYYVPCIWKKILETGKLPERRTHCYFCKRYKVARRYAFICLRTNNAEEDYE